MKRENINIKLPKIPYKGNGYMDALMKYPNTNE